MNFAQQHAVLTTVRSYARARAMAAKAKQTGLPESAKAHEASARNLYAQLKTYLRGVTPAERKTP